MATPAAAGRNQQLHGRLAAVELSKFIRNPDSLLVEEIARGRIELQQIQVSEKSDACGRSLRDLKFPTRIRIGAISRFEGSMIPTADDILQAGDLVTVFGEPRKLHEIVVLPGNSKGAIHHVVFGRVIGVHIADEAISEDGIFEVARVKPIARLGYKDYAWVDETNIFQMEKRMPEDLIGKPQQAAE